jgi:hypothetical protein
VKYNLSSWLWFYGTFETSTVLFDLRDYSSIRSFAAHEFVSPLSLWLFAGSGESRILEGGSDFFEGRGDHPHRSPKSAAVCSNDVRWKNR